MINIVLHQPEIPQNTGNIARTCAVTGCRLHLIHPLGFSLSDKYTRRAGMDYWQDLEVFEYESLEDFREKNPQAALFAVSTKARRTYSQVEYPEDVYFVFGRESAGLPEEFIKELGDHSIRLPMKAESRSLNLSNTAAIMIYEALRQRDFTGLQKEGELHRLSWEDK